MPVLLLDRNIRFCASCPRGTSTVLYPIECSFPTTELHDLSLGVSRVCGLFDAVNHGTSSGGGYMHPCPMRSLMGLTAAPIEQSHRLGFSRMIVHPPMVATTERHALRWIQRICALRALCWFVRIPSVPQQGDNPPYRAKTQPASRLMTKMRTDRRAFPMLARFALVLFKGVTRLSGVRFTLSPTQPCRNPGRIPVYCCNTQCDDQLLS